VVAITAAVMAGTIPAALAAHRTAGVIIAARMVDTGDIGKRRANNQRRSAPPIFGGVCLSKQPQRRGSTEAVLDLCRTGGRH